MAVCGAYSIRPYTGDLKNGDFSICSTTAVVVCGAYAVAPYTDYQKPAGNRVRFYSMNQKSNRNWIRSAPDVAVCGAYAVAPYTGTRKNGDFSICSTTGVAVRGAYSIRPYTDRRKPGWFLVRISRRGGKGGGAWVVRKVGEARFHNYTATVTFAGASQDGTNHRSRSRIHNP